MNIKIETNLNSYFFEGLLVSSNLFCEKNPKSWQHCLGSSVGKAGECRDVVSIYRLSLCSATEPNQN